MKKIVKRTLSFVLACMLLTFPVYANGLPSMGTSAAPKNIQNFGAKVLGYIELAGYAMAVGMLLYLGIKYMMAPANEKANVKNASIKYVIGAVIIGGSAGILSAVQTFSSGITK